MSRAFFKISQKARNGQKIPPWFHLVTAIIPLCVVGWILYDLCKLALLSAWPVLIVMIGLLYLPNAKKEVTYTEIMPGNIRLGKDIRVERSKTLYRNWFYVVLAVLPLISMTIEGLSVPMPEQVLTPEQLMSAIESGNPYPVLSRLESAFSYVAVVWVAIYFLFALTSIFLGRMKYMQLGKLGLAACMSMIIWVITVNQWPR